MTAQEGGGQGGSDAEATKPGELTEEERQQVAKLRARDLEVRQHEQAHAAAGGQYAGAPSYDYQVGPDGKRYAIGGQTPIDASPVPGDPQATVRKMEQVRRAALAPASPSGADLAIAAAATAAAQQACQQATKASGEEAEARIKGDEPAPAGALPSPAAGSTPTNEGVGATAAKLGAYQQVNASASCVGPGKVECSCTTCLPRSISLSIGF
ncbi:MAG: hypothetical protein FJX52_14025 [Alphaproteobacteria bacterium]|nr:hypothetical protein [Alphaproteobacteria bacterium]